MVNVNLFVRVNIVTRTVYVMWLQNIFILRRKESERESTVKQQKYKTESKGGTDYHRMKSESLHKRPSIGGTHAKDLTFLIPHQACLIAKWPTGRVYDHLRWFLCFVHTFRYRLKFWQMWARSRFSRLTWWLWFSGIRKLCSIHRLGAFDVFTIHSTMAFFKAHR